MPLSCRTFSKLFLHLTLAELYECFFALAPSPIDIWTGNYTRPSANPSPTKAIWPVFYNYTGAGQGKLCSTNRSSDHGIGQSD